jgi:hypothetical protein
MDRPAGAVANLVEIASVVGTDHVGDSRARAIGTLHRIPTAGAHYGGAIASDDPEAREPKLDMARGR